MSTLLNIEDQHAAWSLTGPNGGPATVVSSGLSVGEDEDGRYRVGPADGAWPIRLRFEFADGALWLQLLSPQWVLASPGHTHGARAPIDRAVELHLPNNVLQLTNTSLADGRAPGRLEVKPRPSLSWLRPEQGNAESAAERGAQPRPHAAETAVARPADLPGSRPGVIVEAFGTEPPDTDDSDHPPSGFVTIPARGRHRSYNRRAKAELTWPLTVLLILTYLGALVVSAPAQTPLVTSGVAGQASADATEESLLSVVDSLVNNQPTPDPATLEFALEAYRSAQVRHPDDPVIARRIAELQAAVAR